MSQINTHEMTSDLRRLIQEAATFAAFAIDRQILILPDDAADKLYKALNSKPPKMSWNPAIAGVLGARAGKHNVPSFYWRGIPVVKLSDWQELVQ